MIFNTDLLRKASNQHIHYKKSKPRLFFNFILYQTALVHIWFENAWNLQNRVGQDCLGVCYLLFHLFYCKSMIFRLAALQSHLFKHCMGHLLYYIKTLETSSHRWVTNIVSFANKSRNPTDILGAVICKLRLSRSVVV